MIFSLEFKWCESVNARLRPGGRRLVLSDAYQAKKYSAHMLFLSKRPDDVRPTPKGGQQWVLLLDFYFPDDQYERDGDNYVKMLKDALEDVIYEDDVDVIYHDCMTMTQNSPQPRVEIMAIPVTMPEGFARERRSINNRQAWLAASTDIV